MVARLARGSAVETSKSKEKFLVYRSRGVSYVVSLYFVRWLSYR